VRLLQASTAVTQLQQLLLLTVTLSAVCAGIASPRHNICGQLLCTPHRSNNPTLQRPLVHARQRVFSLTYL